jgi:predicted O-linked N-acetylglucosamine transferase (SPINDLY family)
MKHNYQINDHKASYPWSHPDRSKVRREEGLPEEGTVLANFNSLYKLEPDVFSLWARALNHCSSGGAGGKGGKGGGEVGGMFRVGKAKGGAVAEERGGGGGEGTCVLWLVADGAETNENLLRQAHDRGISSNRVILAEV